MRHTFSRLRFGTSYESGIKIKIKEAQYLHSQPKIPKLRSLLANQNDKGPCRRRTGEALLRAEKFGDLSSMRRVNPGTIFRALSWYKI